MARIKGKDLYLKDNDQIYFGDDADRALWYVDDELRLDSTLSGTAATKAYHLIQKGQVDGAISTLSGTIPTVFTDLNDAPNSYTSYESKYVRIKSDGTGLEFAPAIVGTTSSGTTPPEDSNLWYNETYNMFFAKDPVRNKWLSISTHNYLFTFYGNCNGLYLAIGEVKHLDANYPIPGAATITAVLASTEQVDNPSKQFDIIDDSTILSSFTTTGWLYKNMDTDIDVAADGRLKLFCSGLGSKVRNPVVTLEIKWRYEEV